jgi:hypothetical protein
VEPRVGVARGGGFELKTLGLGDTVLKILERSGFDYDLVENLQGY